MIVGYVVAKAHSSRCRGKNMRQFCGKPLLEWTLIQAKYSQIDKMYVSTDDHAIGMLAEKYGAIVHWREHPEESIGDVSGSVPSYFVIRRIFKDCPDMDIGVSFFCTSPLRRPWDIDALIEVSRRTKGRAVVNIPRKDTFLNRIEGDMVSPAIMNKSFDFADELAGLSADTRANLEVVSSEELRPDLEARWSTATDLPSPYHAGSHPWAHLDDNITIKGWETHPEDKPTWKCEFVKGEWWQAVEIDYPEEFELAEYMMKKYLLKDGENVYERYYMAHGG